MSLGTAIWCGKAWRTLKCNHGHDQLWRNKNGEEGREREVVRLWITVCILFLATVNWLESLSVFMPQAFRDGVKVKGEV